MDGQVEVKKPRPIASNKIPEDILADPLLKEAVKTLPENYNFEIYKTLWRIRETKKSLNKEILVVHLQFPEGLLIHATLVADLLQCFGGCECVISGDVTYGACCVDDLTAQAVGADFIVHYGKL